MNLRTLDDIKQDGLTVFMPSGIQATLFLEGDNVLVQYPNLHSDKYSKKDFEKIMDEGIFIFNDLPQNFPQIIESLTEEKGPEAGNVNLEHIAEEIAAGNKSGYEPNEFGNWKLETSFDDRWEKLTDRIKEYILEDISYPVKDGFLRYSDMEILFNKNYFNKEDLQSLDCFTDEEIDDEDIEELSAYTDFEIIADNNIDNTLGESVLSKLTKKGFIRESLLEDEKTLSFLGLNIDDFESKKELIKYIEEKTDYKVTNTGDYFINIKDKNGKEKEIQLNLEHKMKEAFENTKRQEGEVFKAMKAKKKEYITPEFKTELLNCLDKIAKEYPDAKVRQQALTLMDEVNLQEYYDIKKVQDFVKKNLEVINAKVVESADEAFKLKDKKKKKKKLDELADGLRQPIKRWYKNQYPTDEVGNDIKANVTFEDVDNNIEDMGDILGVHDTVVRERVFAKLKELKNVDYDEIYYRWLGDKMSEAINEDVYKVYNSIEGKDCGVFNSWNDIEEFLNREWGDYKASMVKENPEFGNEEQKDLFFGNYELTPVQLPVAVEPPAETIEEPAEVIVVEEPAIEEPQGEIVVEEPEEEICPHCGKPKTQCDQCALDKEDCEGCEDIEVPEDAQEIDVDEIITEMCMEKLPDPNEPKNHAQMKKDKKEKEEKKEKDEAFKDGMITDINDLDFPDALHDAVDTKEDGSLLRLQDVFDMVKELKADIEGIKTDLKDALVELKQGIKDDVKDIQADVNSKLDNTDSKISDLTSEEEMIEEPLEEEPEVEEEVEEEKVEEPEEEMEESFEEMRKNPIYKQMKSIIESNKHPKGLISVGTISQKLREDYGVDIKAECTYNLIKALCEKAPEFKSHIVDAHVEKTTLKECMLGKAAKWISGGLMESLAKQKQNQAKAIMEEMRNELAKNEDEKEIQQEIDKLHAQNKDDKIKDTIDVMADTPEEAEKAKKYALNKVQESKANELISRLKQTSKTAKFSDLNLRG